MHVHVHTLVIYRSCPFPSAAVVSPHCSWFDWSYLLLDSGFRILAVPKVVNPAASDALGLDLHCSCFSSEWNNLADLFPVGPACQSVDPSCTIDLQVVNVPKTTTCRFLTAAHVNQRGKAPPLCWVSPSLLIATVSLSLTASWVVTRWQSAIWRGPAWNILLLSVLL